eukprot:c5218_g1_i1.p1 GENE.c5218_g1_i1~~c5218_g1_i1.p1  ORF type:complete len:493 (-),score=100.26 c5218_g1_i1:44-1486(-)
MGVVVLSVLLVGSLASFHLCPHNPDAELRYFLSDAHEALEIASSEEVNLRRLVRELGALNQDALVRHSSNLGNLDEQRLSVCGTDTCLRGSEALEAMDLHGELEAKRRVPNRIEDEKKRSSEEESEIRALEENPLVNLAKSSYKMGKRLGRGGFKTVYKGVYQDKPVAIAVIKTQEHFFFLGKREKASLNEELRIQEEIREQTLGGKHLCRDFIVGIHGKRVSKSILGTRAIYVVMDLADGDLDGVNLDERNRGLGIALQMAAGLKCVQKAGYVHRDIKPLNTLLSLDGKRVWTHDFGLSAKFTDEDSLALEWGTEDYMPYERAAASKELYDIFALGMSFDELGLRKWIEDLIGDMKDTNYKNRPDIDEVLKRIAREILTPVDKKLSDSKSTLQTLESNLSRKRKEIRQIEECCRNAQCDESKLRHAKKQSKEISDKVENAKVALDAATAERDEMLNRLILKGGPGKLLDKLMAGHSLVE